MNMYFRLAKYQMRKKSNFIVAIIIGLVISIVFLLNTYQTSWHNYIQKDTYDQLVFRNLYIESDTTSEEEMEVLRNIDHVSNVTYMYEYSEIAEIENIQTNNIPGYINIYEANNKSLPKIVEGTNFLDNEGYYMVCPANFYPNTSEEEIRKYSIDDKIDLQKNINTDISLKYMGNLYSLYKIEDYIFSTKVKLVGLYKNSDYSIDENICYVNQKTMQDIVLNKYKDDMVNYESSKSGRGFILTVDSADKMNYVMEKLDDLGFFYRNGAYVDTDYINEINNNINFGVNIIFILVFIFIFIMFQKDFKEDISHYKLLYKIGYNSKEIKNTYLITSLFKSLIYLFVVILFSLISCIILKIILNYYPFLFVKFRIIFDYKCIFIIILIFITNALINNILNIRKVIKND